MIDEDELIDTERDEQVEEDGREQKPDEDEAIHCKKLVEKSGIPNTQPARGDEVIVNYTSIFSDGSRMDNTYKDRPYSFTIGANSATKGFEKAVSSMNLHEKAQFEISHKWLYGKAGIPSNVPPETDFIFTIHFTENRKQKSYKQVTDRVAVIENEAMPQAEPEQERTQEVVLDKVVDFAVVDVAIEAATNPQEEASLLPIQPDQDPLQTYRNTQPFLAKGPQTKHKT